MVGAELLADWLETPQGRYVLDWELRQFDNAVDDVFGYHAVQVGCPGVDFLRENRIPLKVPVGMDAGSRLRTQPWSLPFASQSIDLIALPHVLEFSEHPHRILREAERVLMPEGSIIISGFNPLSLWGAKRMFGARRDGFPWAGRFIGLLRLRDWLHLLGFELNGGRFGCYAPPFASARWLERSNFLEKAGDRWWPIAGGVYVVRAVKHTVGMRLVKPSWRERAASQALAPVTQREAAKMAERIIRSAARRDPS
jgi:SAM-dependent methyltransferase